MHLFNQLFSLFFEQLLQEADIREELEESGSLLVFKFVGSEDVATTVSLGVGKTFFLASVSKRFISTLLSRIDRDANSRVGDSIQQDRRGKKGGGDIVFLGEARQESKKLTGEESKHPRVQLARDQPCPCRKDPQP